MGNFFTKKKSSAKPRNNYEEFFLLNKPSAEDDDYERMHLSHNLTREIFEGNFSSPIHDILLDENTKVLDIGCGAGYWLREMAADFQRPKYFGIDMLPIFFEYAFPNNTTFLQHDFLQGLPFEDGTFDFIHMQYLAWDFTELSWETFVYQELARVLKPGGWLEITDIDMDPVNAGPTIKLLIKSTSKAFVSKNVNLNIIQRYNSLVKSIPSFSSSSLNCESSSLPLGNWADRIGESGTLFVKETCKAFLQGQIGKDMKIKRKNINSTLEEIVKEFESYRTSFNVHRFYVQKSL